MSSFTKFAETALGITQSFFGESITYKSGAVETTIKAVFETQWIEVNGVSAQAMTCQVQTKDLAQAPKKNDQVIRGAKTYTVSVSQLEADENLYTLILKD